MVAIGANQAFDDLRVIAIERGRIALDPNNAVERISNDTLAVLAVDQPSTNFRDLFHPILERSFDEVETVGIERFTAKRDVEPRA